MGRSFNLFCTNSIRGCVSSNSYTQVVRPLDHPAPDTSLFGKAVSRRGAEGGGWLTWVMGVDNVEAVRVSPAQNNGETRIVRRFASRLVVLVS